jgi:hypothetical protein
MLQEGGAANGYMITSAGRLRSDPPATAARGLLLRQRGDACKQHLANFVAVEQHPDVANPPPRFSKNVPPAGDMGGFRWKKRGKRSFRGGLLRGGMLWPTACFSPRPRSLAPSPRAAVPVGNVSFVLESATGYEAVTHRRKPPSGRSGEGNRKLLTELLVSLKRFNSQPPWSLRILDHETSHQSISRPWKRSRRLAGGAPHPRLAQRRWLVLVVWTGRPRPMVVGACGRRCHERRFHGRVAADRIRMGTGSVPFDPSSRWGLLGEADGLAPSATDRSRGSLLVPSPPRTRRRRRLPGLLRAVVFVALAQPVASHQGGHAIA